MNIGKGELSINNIIYMVKLVLTLRWVLLSSKPNQAGSSMHLMFDIAEPKKRVGSY